MARLQLTLPASLPFSTLLPLYTQHINWAGHLDNAQLLLLVSEARVRYLNALGYQESNIEGHGLIVTDAAVQYLSEAFYGQTLRIDMGFADANKYGGDWVWRAHDAADGRAVAQGKTGFVLFDTQLRKPTPLPAAFLARVAQGTAGSA